VVVIDIEGAIAITKSSKTIFGLFLEYKTVVHDGVPLLLRNIANNGYKLLYMAQRSTNASELSTSSKVRLAHIHPELPPGPIFHSPESLVRGFGAHRTDLFKAAALRGLKTLFSPTHNPYSACFCTRPHDTVVFSRYGVVDGRIFLVCENGDITTLNRTFRRTFQELTESLDTMFPPVRGMQ
jgi:phosphatidate phosphatase PAH1